MEGAPKDKHFFAEGSFFHSDGCARFIATAPRGPMTAPSEERPLILNTGRIRGQRHTMTRTGKSVRLAGRRPEPLIEMHPADASERAEGDIAEVASV